MKKIIKGTMMTKDTNNDEVVVFNVFLAVDNAEESIVNYNHKLTVKENALVQKHCDILTGYCSIINYNPDLTPEANALNQNIFDTLRDHDPLTK